MYSGKYQQPVKNAMAGLDISEVGRMKDLNPVPGDTGSDDGDSVSHETVEEQIEIDSDHTEERFRVDRRKLEQMLQLQGCDAEKKTAEQFFQQIMEETNTQITWPSKLKIGAKSKKDPHVKVSGMKEDIVKAKDRIMAVLDTKSNRVTLKMDVSHTDHSHVIGKGGNNIKKVMQDTGCHIHFPDSNRNTQSEKSNQVSLAGQPGGVELARLKIRDLLPLVFMFELPVQGLLQPVPDVSSPTLQQVQQTYDVTVTIKQRPRMYSSTVVVRGTVNNAKAVKEATAVVMEHLVGSLATTLPVSTQLEVAPQHHLFMIGRSGANIKQIMQQTGASIHFPDPNTASPQRKGTVFITGAIESVFLARQQLIGCLPLVLMFDMKEEVDVDQGQLAQLMEQLDVFISVKPKPKQPSKSVIVKSIERNAVNMYDARLRLLGVVQGSMPVTTQSFTSQSKLKNNLSIAGLGLITPTTMLNVNTTNLVMLNGVRSQLPSPSGATPGVISNSTGLVSPLMLFTPTAGYPAMHIPPSMCPKAQIPMKRDVNHNTALVRVPTPSDRASSSSSDSPCDSPSSNASLDLNSMPPSQIHDTRRVPKQVEVNVMTAGLTNGHVDVSVSHGHQKRISPSNSGSRSMLSCLRDPNATIDPASSLGSLTGSPEMHKRQPFHPSDSFRQDKKVSFQNGDRSSESGCDSDASDSRAPGSQRQLLGPNLQSLFSWDIDYEEKKLLANKAMQKKPLGESRTPTDFWSGLGFSKSMPDSAIRECLQLQKNRYNGPTMSTTYEGTEPTESSNTSPDEFDRDPWKVPDHGRPIKPPMNPAPGEYPRPCRKMMETCLTGSTSSPIDSVLGRPLDCWPRPSPPPGFENGKPDLAELFSKLGLGKYTDLFQQQEIDLQTFLTLTDKDLKELGISTFGARKKMLLAIADLNKSETLFSPPAPVQNGGFRDAGQCGILTGRRHDIASQSGRW